MKVIHCEQQRGAPLKVEIDPQELLFFTALSFNSKSSRMVPCSQTFPHSYANKKAAPSASCQGKRLSLNLPDYSEVRHCISPEHFSLTTMSQYLLPQGNALCQ
jgi:hypothetical protein